MPWQWFCTFFFVVLLAECEYLMDLIVQYHVMAVNGWNRGGFIIDGWVAALLNRSCVYNLMVMVPIMFVSLLLRVQPHVHSPFFSSYLVLMMGCGTVGMAVVCIT
eukprot:850581_1